METKEVSLAELCMKHRREGMREVVKWIDMNGYEAVDGAGDPTMVFELAPWQAQLKEWRIDENRTAEDNQETG